MTNNDNTRAAACQDPESAFLGARDIEGPHDDTRAMACQDPQLAYFYARYIDKAPRDDTRRAACRDPEQAHRYAYYVDKIPRNDTRAVACQDPEWAYYYAYDVDKGPRDDTRAAACQDPKWGYHYVHEIDELTPVSIGMVEEYDIEVIPGIPVVWAGCQCYTLTDWRACWRDLAADHGLDVTADEAARLLAKAEKVIGNIIYTISNQ